MRGNGNIIDAKGTARLKIEDKAREMIKHHLPLLSARQEKCLIWELVSTNGERVTL